jgi:hypothetical protein
MDDDIPSWDAVYRKIQGGKLEIVSSESLQGFVFKLIYYNELVKINEEYILKMVVLSDENEGLVFHDGHRSVALGPRKTTATLSQFAREYYLQKFVHKQTSLSVKVYDFSYMDWFASRKLLDELRLISDSDTRRVLDTLKSYKRAIGIITMDVAKGWLMKPEMLTDFEVHKNYALQNRISAQIMVLFTHCRIIDTDNNFMVDGSKVTMIDFGKAIQLDDFYQRDTLLDFYETKAGVPFTYSSVKLTKVEFIETLKKIAILYYCIFKTFYATDDSVELLVFKHLFDTPGWGETPEETDLPYHFDPRQKEWKRHDHFVENLKEIMDLYAIMSTSEGEYHPPTNLSKFDQTKSFCKGGMCEKVTRAFTYVAGKRKRRRTRKK